MKRQCGILKCMLLVLTTIIAVSGFCKRPGHYCHEGTCMVTPSGERYCECSSPDIVGHDCRIPRDMTENCTINCLNKGVCYAGHKCYCDFGYFGKRCEFRNESNICTDRYMEINIKTEGLRDVYVRHHRQCKFPLDGRQSSRDVYSYARRILLSPYSGSPCGGVIKKVMGYKTTYTVLVDVRIEEGQLSPFDYAMKFICTFEEHGIGMVQDAPEEESRYKVTVMDDNGQFVSGAVDKQNKFSLVFYSLQPGSFEIDVLQLRLYDEKTSRLMYDVLDKGCPTVPGEEWLENQPVLEQVTHPNGTHQDAKVINFRPMQAQYDIVFDYKIKLCPVRCPFRYCDYPRLPRAMRGLRINVY